jgi:predicted Zn-dependent peptidase
MRDFHAHWYQPTSITAAVVGNLPVDQLIQIIEDSFLQARQHSAIAPSSPSSQFPHSHSAGGSAEVTERAHGGIPRPIPPIPVLSEPSFSQIQRRDVIDPTLQQARLVMTWRVPGLNNLAETYALDVLASVLGRGRTSRLVRDLREERGLVSSISASNMTYQHQGVFYISAQLPAENLEVVEAAIAQHLSQLQEALITQAEITKIRTRTANHFIFGNETPSDRAGLYGYYHSLIGDLNPAIHYPDHIRAVNAEAIRTAVQRYLSPEAYGVVTIQPGHDS